MFSANGNWNMHDAMSTYKAQKTFFAINRQFAQLYCLHDLSIQNRLLHTKAMPVKLYGPELCGISNINVLAIMCAEVINLHNSDAVEAYLPLLMLRKYHSIFVTLVARSF
jgi:hypothetical protein